MREKKRREVEGFTGFLLAVVSSYWLDVARVECCRAFVQNRCD
jgi:hypothetical protein